MTDNTVETTKLELNPNWKDRVSAVASQGDCLSPCEFDSYVDALFQNRRPIGLTDKPFSTLEETFGLLASDDQVRAAKDIVCMLLQIEEINTMIGWDFDHYRDFGSDFGEEKVNIFLGLDAMRKVDFGVLISQEGVKHLKRRKTYMKFGKDHDWVDLTGVDLMELAKYEGWF